MKRAREHSLVVVRWLDANFDLDKEQECTPMLTVGYVIRHTAQTLCVASEASEQMDYFRAYTSIPTGMVLSVSPLAKGKGP